MIKKQTVYVLMVDHKFEILQHCLGVFTTFDNMVEAQKASELPTLMYETEFEYSDDFPPVKNEFAIVETQIIGEMTAVLRATNLPGTYTNTRQMAFIDPDTEYIVAYNQCLRTNEQDLIAVEHEINGTDPVYDDPQDMLDIQEMLKDIDV